MVHQLVSAVNDRFRLLRILVRPVAHHKKSCLDLVFCQNIKDLLRIVRAPGGIKGDRADLLIPLDAVDRQLPCGNRRTHRSGCVDRTENGDRAHRRRSKHQPFALEYNKPCVPRCFLEWNHKTPPAFFAKAYAGGACVMIRPPLTGGRERRRHGGAFLNIDAPPQRRAP